MSEEFTTPPPVPPVEPAVEKSHSFREEAWETFRFLLIALVIVVPIRIFIAQPFIVSGASMDPTFKDKQYLIVDELSYHLGDPSRGDVAIFKYPKNPKQYFIKRVIGLPGETVLVNGQGQVFIKDADGKIVLTMKEPYVKLPKDDSVERTLKLGEYFMMGDNRSGSFDSRAWGPVNRDLIVGKAFLRLFPLTEIDVLPGQYRQE
ncbi:MAG: Signal peptidase I [Parcubacteria group bacterium GW2011_GWA1_44_13]|uniref:Signal peptidase I n=1 Tax=Candidatus Nomurabacteria bacterium GW2011_GWB1_44_12 TaxID=1618748 RepID=A0A837I8J5_9BACT|nr:MAG: Signal peptidase I [Candidatus Nomurabacteria bacterium GW2011_GWD1_44_10]KKT37156.1 MAG: Signal peptidase I [Candidatus Nomurabacteria bacterium GW2011_GWB1_44_12]KKT38451.1 MAG: Signal peptidase I [Parcubacteria group bacterium GW2011_GWA1_44_13]KKT60670.1 MAG: Signal peptidase I [Parcubacteria group bacterium GW2011_GWC1_44_26]